MELDVNENIITWAISRAGYDLQEFIDKYPKLKVKDWLDKTKKPTLGQLEKFSSQVYLPFGYLFLQNPPEEKFPIPFFRSNKQLSKRPSINVYDTIVSIQQRQDWLKDFLAENKYSNLDFVGKFSGSMVVQDIVEDIKIVLELQNNWAARFSKSDDAVNHITEKIEDVGIIVVFNGVVEYNNHRPIDVDECRGFVLVDPIAPFMFVNNSDSKSGQLFTIIHELAHIWTGRTAGFDLSDEGSFEDPIEILCDRVAVEFLVPEVSFNYFWRETPNIQKAARFYKVSDIVIARRALELNKITKKEFFDFYNIYKNRVIIKKKSTGGDFYALARKKVSITFAAHVNHAVKSDKLLYRDAYKLTSLKGDTYSKFINAFFL